MNITSLSPQQLRNAADLQEKILELQNELDQLLGAPTPAPAAEPSTQAPRKYKFSAAVRAKMRAAQKARWAALKAAKGEPVKKGKRKMSAEGLANIRAGVAKRMAAKGKAVQKPKKRKMTPAWRAALARAWEARRGKAKAGKAKL